LEVSSRDLAIDHLLQLARLDYPVSGNLSVDLSMHGSQLNPIGKGSVRLTRATVYGQSFERLSIQSEGNGDALTSSLDVSLPAGSVKANLILYPKRKGYELQLNVPGINLAQLKAVQNKNLGVAGVLTANVNGHGTIDDPQLTLTAQSLNSRFAKRACRVSRQTSPSPIIKHSWRWIRRFCRPRSKPARP